MSQQFEDVVVGEPQLRLIGAKIKLNLYELLPEHIGHKVRMHYDGHHVVWLECLDCDTLWTHCDFCKIPKLPEYKGAKRLLDFGCRECVGVKFGKCSSKS